MATIFSLLLAIYLLINPLAEGDTTPYLQLIIGAFALFSLLTLQMLLIFGWAPLGKAEESFTWRILDMQQKDIGNWIATGWIVFFVFASLALMIDLFWVHQFQGKWLTPIWILLLGITIDAFLYKIKKIYTYLSPFGIIQMFAHQAKKSIQNEKELDLCHWIEALSEIAYKSLEKHSTSICHEAISEMQRTSRCFLESTKTLAFRPQDQQSVQMGISDKVSYTLFYLFQRLEMIHEKAVHAHSEVTSEQIISALGKITVDAAKYDLSMASYPLYYFGKFITRDLAAGMHEIGNKATCILIEVAKAIVSQVDLTYQELKTPFLSLINDLDKIAKETFRQDKTTNIQYLIQPFLDLKNLFETNDRIKHHQDTPALIQSLDRIIGEFNTLDVVMKTMPPISTFTQPETTSSS